MIKRLTKMEFANASLLDEASSAGEAVLMAWRTFKKKKNTVIVDKSVFKTSQDVVKTYCHHLNIKVVIDEVSKELIESHKNDLMGVLL